MTILGDLDFIKLLEFYLSAMFVLSTAMRLRQYVTIIRLVRALPGRWPRLLALVKQHHVLFVTWSNIWPTLVALGLCVVHSILSRLVWPHASLTGADLRIYWPAIPFLVVLAIPMLAVDGYATFTVGKIDRKLMEGYFDQAEYWLRSWAAPVVRVFTLGRINPRKMVAVEVRKALEQASQLLNWTMRWVIIQVSLRIIFGTALWLTWAWTRFAD